MNLLEQMTITGDIRLAYGLFSIRYTFCNNQTEPLSPRYLFPLPEGSVLSGLQILTDDRRLVRAAVAPLSRSGAQNTGARLVQLEPQVYCLEWENLPPGRTCEIMVDFTLGLTPSGKESRLFLPLGLHLPSLHPQHTNACPVTIDLTVDFAATAVTSPTHAISQESTQAATSIHCSGTAGEDFILDLRHADQVSCCFLQEPLGKGLGLYRICTTDQTQYCGAIAKRICMILDLTGIQSAAKTNAVKELLFRTIETLPKDMLVQVLTTSPETPVLFPAFLPVETAADDRTFSMIAELSSGLGSLDQVLEQIKDQESADTKFLLFSGGTPAQQDAALRTQIDAHIHLFTTGMIRQTEFARRWVLSGHGIHQHFYGRDALSSRIPKALKSILGTGSSVRFVPEDSTVHDLVVCPESNLGFDGYQDLLITYTGQAPRFFSIWHNGIKEEVVRVPDTLVFDRLPFVEQLYAKAKTEQLQALLAKTSLESHGSIKREIESTGIRFGMVNSETMLVIEDETNQPCGVPVTFCSGISEGLGEFSQRTSIFGEDHTHQHLDTEQRDQLFALCREILLAGVRSDGAITAPGCYLPEVRAEHTAFALLALPLCTAQDPSLLSVYTDAEAFLEATPPKGVAGLLFGQRGRFLDAKRQHHQDFHQMLPTLSELSVRLQAQPGDVLAAAQIVLRIAL